MGAQIPVNTSGTARLMGGAPGFAIGWQKTVLLPKPAAGAGWTYKIDGRYVERVIGISFVLNTSAVVANRFPAVNLLDNLGNIISSVPAGGAVVASSSITNYLFVGAPAYGFGSSGGNFGFMPDIVIPGDWAWQALVSSMDAGDQISNIFLITQQFPNDAASYSVGG